MFQQPFLKKWDVGPGTRQHPWKGRWARSWRNIREDVVIIRARMLPALQDLSHASISSFYRSRGSGLTSWPEDLLRRGLFFHSPCLCGRLASSLNTKVKWNMWNSNQITDTRCDAKCSELSQTAESGSLSSLPQLPAWRTAPWGPLGLRPQLSPGSPIPDPCLPGLPGWWRYLGQGPPPRRLPCGCSPFV